MRLRNFTKPLAAALAWAALVFLPGCGGGDAGEPPLRVGMDLSYPPFETIGPDGRPSGISVDLARALGEFLNRPVQIENIPFTGLLPSLQTGKIDLILSSMTDTPERREAVDFSDAYLRIGLALLVGADSSLEGLADLDQPGRTVAVRQGTTGQVWAQANLQNAQLIVLEKENSAVLEVIQGKADAFVYDQMSVWKNARQHPERLRALLEPLRVESWAVALRKGEDDLRAQVNAFFQKFREEGGFERLGDEYLREQKEAFAEQGLPFYF
jgi:polar amino acid transport system substrate-binding protein